MKTRVSWMKYRKRAPSSRNGRRPGARRCTEMDLTVVIHRRFVFIVFGLALFFLSRPALFGQVLRRDPAEAPAPLVVHKHTYKPEGQLRAWLVRPTSPTKPS